MNYKEAYTIICEKYKSKPYLRGCMDFGDVFGFWLSQDESSKFVGNSMIAVNKNTKKVFTIPIGDKKYDYRKAKRVV